MLGEESGGCRGDDFDGGMYVNTQDRYCLGSK